MIYIIDTNIITAIMKDDKNVKRRAQEAILKGDDIFINGIAIFVGYYIWKEFKSDFLNSKNSEQV